MTHGSDRHGRKNVIAIATDAALFPPAYFLASRLTMLCRDDTEIVLFSDAFEELRAAQALNPSFDLRHLEASTQMPGGGLTARLSGAMFYRMFLPGLLPEARRILYLDVDTYPETDDVFRPFDLDMEGAAIAAVRDYQSILTEMTKPDKRLNSGVLLIDPVAYKAANLQRRWWHSALRQSTHDQAALNYILRENWLELSPAFNMTPYGFLSEIGRDFASVVTHFMGPTKPWSGPRFWYDHNARAELEAFLKGSPWATFLSRHFGVSTALTHTAPHRYKISDEFKQRARKYLDTTIFADVAQGITCRIRPACA